MRISSNPLTWNRQENVTKTQRGFDFAMAAASDEDRRMEHSNMSTTDPTLSFWNLISSLPRQDQATMAANGLASRLAQNGINGTNLSLIRSFPARFTREEMLNIEGMLKENPMLQMSGSANQRRLIEQLKEIWMGNEQRQGFTPELMPIQNPAGNSPVELFFRSSFLKRPDIDQKRVTEVTA